MGQKVHPYGFRLGYNKNWLSRWFAGKKEYAANVFEDDQIRKFLKKKLYHAGISRLEIERAGGKVRLLIFTARPGIVIGRKGVEIEKLRGDLKQRFGRRVLHRGERDPSPRDRRPAGGREHRRSA